MSYVKKLIIGTANFGKEYNGHRVSHIEAKKIWEYCVDVGIELADCASAYEYTPPSWVKTINKITAETDQISKYATLIHHTEDVPKLWPVLWQYKLMSAAHGYPFKIGVSIYSRNELTCLPYDIVQLPYAGIRTKKSLIANTYTFQNLKKRGIETHVRSVFRDNCFEQAVKDKHVDYVIIGIDNVDQLKENVALCKEWDKK